MIPILFDGSSTNFNTNGIGRLTDTISCLVTEERNGSYELEMQIATTSPHFNDIQVGALIVAQPFKNGNRQAFEIYEISKPINQIVTVKATHLSYRASYIPVAPFSAEGITESLQGLNANCLETNPFTLSTDFTNETSTFNVVAPKSLRACLGGTEGSLLDTFGGGGAGEYLWDNWNIAFLTHRGADRGVYLRYGKNITELTHTENIEDMVTGVLPYWTDPEDQTISFYGDIQYSPYASLYAQKRTVCLDLTSEFETAPSREMLNDAGYEYITSASVGIPNETIELTFVDLSETGEQAILEQVNLCDTIHVIYSPLDIAYEEKVIKTTWNVLKERYEKISIGKPRSSLAKTLSDNIGNISELINTGKKLVSVTQIIDREIGEINSTVASVEEYYDDLDRRVTTNETNIRQNADEIELKASTSYVDSEVGAVGERVTTLETSVVIDTSGLKLTQGTEGSYVQITDSGMEIYVGDSKQAYATAEGFSTTALNINNGADSSYDWCIKTSNDSTVLNFFRKG